MERVLILVACVAMLNSAAKAEEDAAATTLEDLLIEEWGLQWIHFIESAFIPKMAATSAESTAYILRFSNERFTHLPLTDEFLAYLLSMQLNVYLELASDLSNVTQQSLCQDLNEHCAQNLETPIEDLTAVPSNVTCVFIRLRQWLIIKLKIAIEVGVQKLSRKCSQQLLPLCSKVHRNCTLAFEERIGKLLSDYIEAVSDLELTSSINVILQYPGHLTPLYIISIFVSNVVGLVWKPYEVAATYMTIQALYVSSVPSIEPYTLVNILHPRTNEEGETVLFKNDITTLSQGELTWGIITSNAGTVNQPCSYYRDTYQRGSQEYLKYLTSCYTVNVYHLTFNVIRCAYKQNNTSTPLAWSTVSSAYFQSRCLCLTYSGAECRFKAPNGVDSRLFCLSALLRDFQRQIWHRPAVTYLDYAFMTRIPICKFANILQIGFKKECDDYKTILPLDYILSLQCFFNGNVNKHMNCSKTPLVKTHNETELCGLVLFMEYVLCEGDGDVEPSVAYYAPGDSPLVQVLTYVDVSVRVLTLTTYLACARLRNLPGKLLIGYQVTALLRLVVVRPSLEDLALAVRLDVTFDLASTLWLTAYLQFLTSSIRTLRLPDSLTTAEALVVLLRSGLFGWALPAALSATFFWLDEALDSRLMIGQLLFVLCNFVALLANLFMFFYNSHMYYDIKRDAFALKVGGRARSVFADLFNFALKTSVLSGAGIIFRLVFTQIQGLEHLLSYYHVLGTLQALLFFGLYGYNTESREFWRRFLCTTLSLSRRRQSTVV